MWYKEAKLEDKIRTIIKRYPGNGIKLWILDNPKEIYISFGDWADDIGKFIKELEFAAKGKYKITHDFETLKPDTRKWKKISSSQIPINTSKYEQSLKNLLQELENYSSERHKRLSNFKFNWNMIQSILQKYNYTNIHILQESIKNKESESIYNFITEINNLRNNLERSKQINYNQGKELGEVSRELRELWGQILQSEEERSPMNIEERFQEILNATKGNAVKISSTVQQSINRISNWNTPITIEVMAASKDDYLEPMTSVIVEFGEPGEDLTPSFTIFSNNSSIEIEDLIEADDTDFFRDPKIKSDYYNLVKELRNPGSSSKEGKILTLYTARPVKDRHIYENGLQIPSNIFLTSSLPHAEGIAMELKGKDKIRDVWKVSIDSRYLIQTLEGSEKQYQVVGDYMVPVKRLTLVSPGEST